MNFDEIFFADRKAKPPTSAVMMGKIIALSELGKSTRQILVDLKRMRSIGEKLPNQSTIVRILQKFRQYGTPKRLSGQGRKRKTTPRDDRRLLTIARTNRKTTLGSVSSEFAELTGISISQSTASRRLKGQGYKVCRCARKPLISQKNRKKRLIWCKENIQRSDEYWRSIWWSDESRFAFVSDRPQNCIRRSTERFRPDCLQTTVKHGGGGLMVWGAFSAAGVGALHRVNGTVNAIAYIDILERNLISTLDENHPNGDGVFQQDNAPCHTARSVKKWFADNDITWIDNWPAQSPDINPIENLWDYIDRRLRKSTYKNADEMWNAIKSIWESIPIDFLQHLVSSVPRRLQAVIDNKGGPTKY